jgi:hypothetical protein
MDNVTLIRLVAGIFAVLSIPLYFLPTLLGWKRTDSLAIFLVIFFSAGH